MDNELKTLQDYIVLAQFTFCLILNIKLQCFKCFILFYKKKIF